MAKDEEAELMAADLAATIEDEMPSVNRYPKTLEHLEKKFRQKYPNTEAIEDRVTGNVGNTLWMIEQISKITDQGKIDRWLGWIQAKAHSNHLVPLEEILNFNSDDISNFNQGIL